MSERAADSVLEIHRVQTIRRDADGVRLRLAGRWLEPSAADEEELLVIEVDGRRHRFVAERERAAAGSDAWSAFFSLPAWAEPRRQGQAVLWVGEVPVPVAPVGFVRVPALAREPGGGALGRAVPVGGSGAPAVDAASEAASAPGPAVVEGPRSGPLAEILLRDTVTALHGELSERVGETARLRAQLADARAEAHAQAERYAALEAAQAELREELGRLSGAVEAQRADLMGRTEELRQRVGELEAERDAVARERDVLAAARDELGVERDSLRRELERLLPERDRLATELAEVAAERDGSRHELQSLRQEVEQARALVERQRAESGRLRAELAAAQVARDAAAEEAAALGRELERLGRELAGTQERVRAESGELGEASRLLEEARALARRLGAESAG